MYGIKFSGSRDWTGAISRGRSNTPLTSLRESMTSRPHPKPPHPPPNQQFEVSLGFKNQIFANDFLLGKKKKKKNNPKPFQHTSKETKANRKASPEPASHPEALSVSISNKLSCLVGDPSHADKFLLKSETSCSQW